MPPDPAAQSDTLAALDIGTNSVHGVVARLTEGESGPRFEILEREKEVVRLGSSAGDIRELDDDAIDRTVAALDRFRQVAEVHRAPITAVATSAVREAENRDVLIDRAWTEAGVHIDVVSGIEEARLIHLGVLQAVPVFDQRLLLCDIGGGSTELLVGLRGEVLRVALAEAGGHPAHPPLLRRRPRPPRRRRRLPSLRAVHPRPVRPRGPRPRAGGRHRVVRHDRRPGCDGRRPRHRVATPLDQQPGPPRASSSTLCWRS